MTKKSVGPVICIGNHNVSRTRFSLPVTLGYTHWVIGWVTHLFKKWESRSQNIVNSNTNGSFKWLKSQLDQSFVLENTMFPERDFHFPSHWVIDRVTHHFKRWKSRSGNIVFSNTNSLFKWLKSQLDHSFLFENTWFSERDFHFPSHWVIGRVTHFDKKWKSPSGNTVCCNANGSFKWLKSQLDH